MYLDVGWCLEVGVDVEVYGLWVQFGFVVGVVVVDGQFWM